MLAESVIENAIQLVQVRKTRSKIPKKKAHEHIYIYTLTPQELTRHQ